MNVERLVEVDPRIEIIGDLERMALGVAERKFAPDIAGAGDQTGAYRARGCRQAQRFDLADRGADLGLRNIRDQQVLPDRQPQCAGAMPLGDVGEAAQLLRGQARGRHHDPDIAKSGLYLWVHADMPAPVDRTALLAHLGREAGRIVPRTALLAKVWETSFDPGSNVVEVHIRNVREKLGTHSTMIETVRGVGYRLAVPTAA